MTSPDAFALHHLLVGCAAELALNDVPLVAADLRRLQGSVHLTPWVVDGVNELRLRIDRTRRLEVLPAGVVAADREAGPVIAEATVLCGFYADLVPDRERDETLVEIAFRPLDDAERPLPCTVVGTFEARDRPRWAWQDAPRLDPGDPQIRAEVLELAREVRAAFARGDGAAVAARMPTHLREAVHFGPSSQDLAVAFAAELADMASQPGHDVATYRDEDVVLRPIAGGRVLRVELAGGGPVVRSGPAAPATWRFRLDVARLDGRMEIARLA